jgi:hypothetical protein
VKNSKDLFPKDSVEQALEDAPGGVNIVLKGLLQMALSSFH